MDYKKQDFEDGNALEEEQLDYMEEGIAAALTLAKEKAKITDQQVGADAWSSRNIVDRLCPAFTESGGYVVCEPAEGYPLEVISSIVAVQDGSGDPSPTNVRPIIVPTDLTMSLSGKNIYDSENYSLTEKYIIRHASGTLAESAVYAATKDYIPCSHIRGRQINLQPAPADTTGTSTGGGIAFYDENMTYISGTNTAQITVPNNAVYLRFCINKDYVEKGVQIQLGSSDTGYEPFREQKLFSVTLPEGTAFGQYDWSTGLLLVTHKAVKLSELQWNYVEDNCCFEAEISEESINSAEAPEEFLCDCYLFSDNSHSDIVSGGYSKDCVIAIEGKGIALIHDGYSEVSELIGFLEEQGATVVYPLTETYTVKYDPEQASALSGVNYITSGAGNITVSGRVDPVAVISALTTRVLDQESVISALTTRVSDLESAAVNNT